MKGAAVALLLLAGCAPQAAREFATGREPAFYREQLAQARVVEPAQEPQREAERGLERVARQWKAISARPEKLVRLIDLENAAARKGMEQARDVRQLDALLARPQIDAVLVAVYARNPQIAAGQRAWRATLSRYAQAQAYDDVLRTYNAWTRRQMVPVGPMKGKGTESIAGSVPYPGMLGALGDLVTQDAAQARDRWLQAVNAVLTDARKLLHKLAWLDQSIAITENHRQAVEAQANVARTRLKAGTGPYADVLKAATELAELEDRLLTFREGRQASAVALNTLLQRPTQAAIGPVAALPHPAMLALTREKLQQTALAGSLELGVLRTRLLRMRQMLAMSSNRDYYKTLQRHYFFDARKRPHAGFDRRVEPPRRMGPADADSGFVTSFLAELRTRIGAMESSLEALDQQTRRRTEVLYFEFDEAWRRTALYRQTVVPKAEQTLAASETAYRAGKMEFLNMVDALRRLLMARLVQIKAQNATLDKLAELEALVNRRLR